MLYMLRWLYPAYNSSWHCGTGSNSLLRQKRSLLWNDLSHLLFLTSQVAGFTGLQGCYPGSCVHASSWTIDSSVDPENFHPDNLQQCVSPTHHLNHSFPVSSLGNSIPYWGLLSAQYLRAPASAVRPKLEGSVCHKREVSSLSYTSWGCNTT